MLCFFSFMGQIKLWTMWYLYMHSFIKRLAHNNNIHVLLFINTQTELCPEHVARNNAFWRNTDCIQVLYNTKAGYNHRDFRPNKLSRFNQSLNNLYIHTWSKSKINIFPINHYQVQHNSTFPTVEALSINFSFVQEKATFLKSFLIIITLELFFFFTGDGQQTS